MLRPDYVPAEQWARLERELRPLSLRRGEFFLRPGDDARRVAVVRKGLLRFFYVDREGREATKAFRGEGELVAAFSEALTGRPARTSIQAVEDCELLTLDYRRLVAYLRLGKPDPERLDDPRARADTVGTYVLAQARMFRFTAVTSDSVTSSMCGN